MARRKPDFKRGDWVSVLTSYPFVSVCSAERRPKHLSQSAEIISLLSNFYIELMTLDQYINKLNSEFVTQIAEELGLSFVPEKEPEGNVCMVNNKEVRDDFKTTFAIIDILDYIYAVLHSPIYLEKYKEFLKIDFPCVPFPKNRETFWQLVKSGGELRQIHLLESPLVDKYIIQDPVNGNNIVTKPRFHSHPPEGWLKAGVVKNTSRVVNTPPEKTIFIKNVQIKLNPILELPYNPNLKQRARELRQAGNLPEVLFWMQVTKGGFYKIDFYRQRVIGNYIVDFYVKILGLVVEIDGESHIGKEDYDREREDFLISWGLRVYRIKVEDIMQRMPVVMASLENYIVEHYGIEPQKENLPPRSSTTPPTEGNLPHLFHSPPPEGCPKDGVFLTSTERYSQPGAVGRVYINDTQYFDNVPEIAWNFYIGGYQPAQKWLKDRKDRKLEFDDILHYQKIIVALTETDRLMKEIDKVDFI